MDLVTRLDELAGQFPDKPAFIYSEKPNRWQTFTYRELADLTSCLTRGLLACGLHPGTRAALMTPPSVEFFALALALLRTGIVPIILDPAIGLKKVTECFSEAEPEIFFGNNLTHALRKILGWGKHTVKHNLSIKHLLQITNTCTARKCRCYHSPNDTCLPSLATREAAVIYTSGSTGLPKGVLYTHGNFSAQLDMLVNTFNIQPDEIDLPAFPLYALIDVLVGVTSVIPDIRFPVPGKVNAVRTLSAIRKFNVTNMFASPVMLDRLAGYGVPRKIELSSLKRVITAGAPAPFRVQRKFKELLPEDACLFGVYGATETLPITVIESREVFGETEARSVRGAGICIGRPVDGAKVRIIGIGDVPIAEWQDSLEVPANQIGEITVQGPAVTRVYIQREDATRLAKIKDGDDVIHRMGDVGYFDEQGRLWYCGRKSQRVVTKDGTWFTEQIEGIFNAHPLVYRTALVGVNRKPVLWVELEPHARRVDKELIKSELIELAQNHLQAKEIKTILFMKKFPTDVRHNSKIIREELARIARGQAR
ncbi:MAG: fatty acid CoA ligase family protein [Chloroflexota bacterium]